MNRPKKTYPTIKEISALLRRLKKNIGDDYRAFDYDEDDLPSMQVTIGCTPETGNWDFQTGDNSYSGGAYLHPYWGVCALYRRSNTRKLAKNLIEEIRDQVA